MMILLFLIEMFPILKQEVSNDKTSHLSSRMEVPCSSTLMTQAFHIDNETDLRSVQNFAYFLRNFTYKCYS